MTAKNTQDLSTELVRLIAGTRLRDNNDVIALRDRVRVTVEDYIWEERMWGWFYGIAAIMVFLNLVMLWSEFAGP